MSTSDPIQIPIEGDATDFIADAKKVQSSMDTLTAKLKEAGVSQAAYNKAVSDANKKSAEQAKALQASAAALDKQEKEATQAAAAQTKMVAASKTSSISITDLRSAYMIAADAARVAGQVWNATGQEFVDYAEQVKNMSRSLGASAEETSRLIQVADDVRISYESLGVAMKMAQKDGIEPNIEGLAKLSDQYLALAPGVQRTKFLLDKFGKSGLEMGKLMEKGGDGIREMSEAISGNLIITEDGIKASDEYQKALDDLQDSAHGAGIEIGGFLAPAMTDILHIITADIQALSTFNEKVLSGKQSIGEWAGEIMNNNPIKIFGLTIGKTKDEVEELTPALDDNADAVATQKEAVKAAEAALNDYKDMLEEVSQANQDAESFMQSYADFSKGYAKDHADALETLREAQRKYFEEVHESGKDSEASIGAAIDVTEAQKSIQELEASWHESTQAMIYDMMMAKVSVDGLTDAEFKATQQLAVTMGLRTQAQADEANAMMDQATALADGIALQEDVMKEKADADAELLRLENEKAIAAGETTTAIVDGSAVSVESLNGVAMAVDSATQSYIAMAAAAWDAAAAAQSAGSGSGNSSSGSGSSGGSGGGSAPVSSNSATKNSIFNISITNPIGDNSASSIRRTLRQIDYLGHPI